MEERRPATSGRPSLGHPKEIFESRPLASKSTTNQDIGCLYHGDDHGMAHIMIRNRRQTHHSTSFSTAPIAFILDQYASHHSTNTVVKMLTIPGWAKQSKDRKMSRFGSLGPWLMGSVGGLALLLTFLGSQLN